MPHMGPAAEASMLDKVVAIASDPVLHKRVLGEFKERQKEAQDAEAKARDAEGKAEAAVKKAERAERKLEEKIRKHDETIAEHIASVLAQKEVLDKQDAELIYRADLLRIHEDKFAQDRTENAVQVNRWAAQGEALVAKEASLTERETALAEQAEAIRVREDKFASRLRDFNAGL